MTLGLGPYLKWGAAAGAALGAAGAVMVGALSARASSAKETGPAVVLSGTDAAELRASMEKMSTRLDEFNRRLSWLEGATSGALKPPESRP